MTGSPRRSDLSLDLIHGQLSEPCLFRTCPGFAQPVWSEILFEHMQGVLLGRHSLRFGLCFEGTQICVGQADCQVQDRCTSPSKVTDGRCSVGGGAAAGHEGAGEENDTEGGGGLDAPLGVVGEREGVLDGLLMKDQLGADAAENR